jgi:hypothetical protein
VRLCQTIASLGASPAFFTQLGWHNIVLAKLLGKAALFGHGEKERLAAVFAG